MNNFDLRKYLAEGKLLKEDDTINEVLFKMDNNKAKEYYKPLADVIKSMGYETNLKAENPGSTQSIESLPQAFLYYNTELPTEEEGVHKGKDVSLASLKGGLNSVNTFMSQVDPHPENTKKEYDFTVNGGRYYAKSEDVLNKLKDAMGDSVDAAPIKKLTSTFTSNKDFKPVTYYKMVMFPKKAGLTEDEEYDVKEDYKNDYANSEEDYTDRMVMEKIFDIIKYHELDPSEVLEVIGQEYGIDFEFTSGDSRRS